MVLCIWTMKNLNYLFKFFLFSFFFHLTLVLQNEISMGMDLFQYKLLLGGEEMLVDIKHSAPQLISIKVGI